MKIRGERECQRCGNRWSYYETGSVACPDCGSQRSVGLEERREHTAGAESLDLQPAREALESEPLTTVARVGAKAAAEFVRQYGFIHAGDLQALDSVFLAATELRHVGTELARSIRVDEQAEAYFLALLDGAKDGDRPSPAAVPDSLCSAHGLAATSAVDDYRRDVIRYLEEHPDEQARRVLGVIDDHRTRIEALDGNVSPGEAEALIDATRAVGTALRDEATSIDKARELLDELDPNDSRSGE
ncbi:TFIIB-type zinc ribbon-containing protein [Halorhabdus sp. CBA1104]|uniref:DUF7117 family protein n=1 Tax=Halorhabdus sp. CBA1104 TaxID=1380432 RepID=UPI0012B28544|nr:TFIIB-type zinc ribbon-containing protein [Halorhabdus sp. CBA1104]QGN06681.1 TFIIB-type zinc ribbon-containing protein [Halorhabdus sp. CBA1104]